MVIMIFTNLTWSSSMTNNMPGIVIGIMCIHFLLTSD